ncbi:MAG TPA: hypothetical protein VMS65_12605 [Polyangiaceae bacterium]|nr:hypothetical protein [Polyangiaceae bacterium]
MTRRAFVRLALVLVGLLASGTARTEAASTPVRSNDVRVALVWIFGDDDALNPPNESSPPSPAASIGDRPGYDPVVSGYRTRYTGRENRLELRLRGAARDFVPALTTAAELALGIDARSLGQRGSDGGDAALRVEDVGSFVELGLSLSGRRASRAPTGDAATEPCLALRLYPIDGDLERVGWLEALGWGGAVGPHRESPYATAAGPVRAARLTVDVTRMTLFAGLKTATFVEPVPNAPAVAETSYGFFVGGEARPSELLHLGIAGGYFEHGRLAGAAARATTAGASARLSIRRGMDEPRSPVTFLGQGDDPFQSTKDASPGAFALGVEAAGLVQRLGDFDRPGQTTLEPARALAAFGGARLGPFETSLALLLRDPEFVMRNALGVFAGLSVPAAAQREAERVVLVSNGLIVSERFRADLALALRFPAAIMTGALDRQGQLTGATLVVNGPGDVTLLPVGSAPVPILDARAAVEARLSSLLSSVLWAQYRRDYNRIRLVAGDGELAVRGFVDPDRFGYGIAARAVW